MSSMFVVKRCCWYATGWLFIQTRSRSAIFYGTFSSNREDTENQISKKICVIKTITCIFLESPWPEVLPLIFIFKKIS